MTSAFCRRTVARDGGRGSTMAKKITDFLNTLTDDSEATLRYIQDPDGVMTEFGLDPWQQHLIKKGDVEQIRSALAAEVGGSPYILIRVIVH